MVCASGIKASSGWAPCVTSSSPATLDIDHARLLYCNQTITLLPVLDNGQVLTTTNATFQLMGIQEWDTDPTYLSTFGCLEPSAPAASGSSWYTNTNQFAGTARNAMLLANMECLVSVVNETLPGTDIYVQTIFIQARNLSVAPTTYVVNISKSYGDNVIEFPGNSYTDGLTYYIKHLYVL